VNLSLRAGALAERILGRAWPGRSLSVRGALRAYRHLAARVRKTRAALAHCSADKDRGRPGRPDRFKLFYYCYGSSHTSVAAAAIHTGRLDPRRTPTVRQLLSIRHFDRVAASQLGTVFPVGSGRQGEDVFVVGLGPGRELIRQTLESYFELTGVPARCYLLVDALAGANWLIRVGGLLSRRLGLVGLGRPLVSLGIRLAYARLSDLVARTRAEVQRRTAGPAALTPPARDG